MRAGLATAGVLALSVFGSIEAAQQAPQVTAPSSGVKTAPAAPYRFQTNRTSKLGARYYEMVWGIDSLAVKYAESGELIRFSYRVLDPAKAKVLNDKKLEPALIDPQASVKLVVPQLEFVGKMRNSSTEEAGKSYWIAFSNAGRPVRPGHFVTVQVGQFKAENLLVE